MIAQKGFERWGGEIQIAADHLSALQHAMGDPFQLTAAESQRN